MAVKIAGIQMCCDYDKGNNLRKAVKMAEIAAQEGAKIICFQELFNTHWFPKDRNIENLSLAEDMDGTTIQAMIPIALHFQVVLICPIFERGVRGIYYNSAVVIDNYGKVLGVYRKNHIPDLPLWEEKFYFKPGDRGFPTFKTDFGVIGIQICWDNFFPEGSRILALKGAEIVFSPTAAAFDSHERWEKVICANAINNNIFFLRINRVGQEEKQEFYGRSFCCNPYGEVISAVAGLNDGIILAEVEMELIDQMRRGFPFFQDFRPEIYNYSDIGR